MHQDPVISFKILLESSMIQDGILKEKTSSLCWSTSTRRRRRNSKEKKSKVKRLGETVTPKKGRTRNL